MTREEAKQLLPVIQAWAEGKDVQHFSLLHVWQDGGMSFDFSDCPDRYRIKPSPTLRPWRPEEVPIGACFRYKTAFAFVRHMIVSIGDSYLIYVENGGDTIEIKFQECLELCEYSTDNGKTWLPCGVVEG